MPKYTCFWKIMIHVSLRHICTYFIEHDQLLTYRRYEDMNTPLKCPMVMQNSTPLQAANTHISWCFLIFLASIQIVPIWESSLLTTELSSAHWPPSNLCFLWTLCFIHTPHNLPFFCLFVYLKTICISYPKWGSQGKDICSVNKHEGVPNIHQGSPSLKTPSFPLIQDEHP